jgi:hypothetical protein
MTAKSTRAPARRKKQSISVVPNVLGHIIFIDPEVRKRATLEPLVLEFMRATGNYGKYNRCPVIPFPIERRLAAKEA